MHLCSKTKKKKKKKREEIRKVQGRRRKYRRNYRRRGPKPGENSERSKEDQTCKRKKPETEPRKGRKERKSRSILGNLTRGGHLRKEGRRKKG